MTQPVPTPDKIVRAADAALNQGDPLRAFQALRSALDAAPAHPEANFLAAKAMLARNDETAALGYLATAAGSTGKAPKLAAASTGAWAELSARRAKGGSPEERAALAQPDQLGRWAALGQSLTRTSPQAAESAWRRVIALQPEDWRGYAGLADVYASAGGAAAAEAAYWRGLQRASTGGVNLATRLGLFLATHRRYTEALDALMPFKTDGQADPEFQHALAATHERRGELAEARTAYERAVSASPPDGPAVERLLAFLWRLNDHDGVRDCLETLGDIETGVRALYRARLLIADDCLNDALDTLAATDGAALREKTRTELAFVKGEAFDKAGRYEQAHAAFAEANAIAETVDGAEKRFKPERLREVFRWAVGAYAAPVSRPADPGPGEALARHAFIVGFPRSGTTLIDMMLSGHAGAITMEEAPHAFAAIRAAGATGRKRPAEVSAAQVRAGRRAYVEAVHAELGAPAIAKKLIVDRHAAIAGWTGPLAELFPASKWAVVVRHPYDVVLSAFMQPFQPDALNVSFRRLESAAEMYDAFMGAHFAAAKSLGLEIHEVRYERLVTEPKPVMQALLDHLGLEWDDAVLDHEREASGRARVATASHAQVIRPLYAGACYRWRRYESVLGPVIGRLKPWAERLGYEG